MALGTNHLTTTTSAVFLPDIWTKEAEIAREENLVMAGLVKRKDFDVATSGDTINIPFVSNGSATAVSDNTAVTFQSPTETQVQVSINRHFESSYFIQNRTKKQSAYDLMGLYSQRAGYALAEQIDTDLTGLYSGLTQTVGTTGDALTEARVVRAIQYLDDASAPMTDRHFVVKPAAMNSLRQIARFTESNILGGGQSLIVGGNRGLIGNLFGVQVHMSQNIQQVSGTPGTVHNLLFHRDAFVLAIQQDVSVDTDYIIDFLGTAIVGSALWGYAELRDSHAVNVRSAIQS